MFGSTLKAFSWISLSVSTVESTFNKTLNSHPFLVVNQKLRKSWYSQRHNLKICIEIIIADKITCKSYK